MVNTSFFSGYRFWQVLRKEILENRKTIMLRLLAFWGIASLLLVATAYLQYDNCYQVDQLQGYLFSSEISIFMWLLCIGSTVSASFMMEGMRSKARRINFLMMPASSFEKYFARWLMHIFLFAPVYFIIFKLADYIRVLFTVCFYPSFPSIGPLPIFTHLVHNNGTVGLFNSVEECLFVFSLVWLFQSLFALGSVIWTRNTYLRSFLTIFGLFTVYVLYSMILYSSFLNNRIIDISLPVTTEELFMIFASIVCVMTVFNWVLAYFRFKESEVINHW